MEKKWSRVAWREKDQEEEGVIPSLWVKNGHVMWPKGTNVLKAMKEMQEPEDNWLKFKLIKVKFSSDKKKDCEAYCLTTTSELSSEDEYENEQKRRRRRKIFNDYITGSGAEKDKDSSNTVQRNSAKEQVAYSNPSKSKSVLKSCSNSGTLPQAPQPPIKAPTTQLRRSPRKLQVKSKNNPESESDCDSSSLLDTLRDRSPVRRSQQITPDRRRPPVERQRSPVQRQRSPTPGRRSPVQRPRYTPDRRQYQRITPDRRQSQRITPDRRQSQRITPDRRRRESETPDREISPVRRRTNDIRIEVTPQQNPFPMPNDRFQKRVLQLLVEIRDLIKNMKQPEILAGGHIFQDFELEQLITMQDFLEFEDRLEDNEIIVKVKAKMRILGGGSAGDHIKNIMKRCMTNGLMSKMNIHGKNGKFAFGRTNLCKLIKDCIIQVHNGATETSIVEEMSRFLKYAPGRMGGGGRRAGIEENEERTQSSNH